MDGATIAVISTAIGTAIGALLRYLQESRKTAASIEDARRQREQAKVDQQLAFLQAEITRISTERDRLMAIVLTNVATMNESAKTLEEKAGGQS